jgi:hypothetical protein
MAFVNGDSVKVQHGKVMGELQRGPSVTDHENVIPHPKWQTDDKPSCQSAHRAILV